LKNLVTEIVCDAIVCPAVVKPKLQRLVFFLGSD